MRTTLTAHRGFSLAEVTIMLMTLSVLTAAMSPAIGDYVNDARHIKVADDVRMLAVTFSRFAFDAAKASTSDRDWHGYDVLVGEGLAPELGQGGDAAWVLDLDQHGVGRLDDHLITNAAGYNTSADNPEAIWVRGWRGPYVGSGITPDPWGHRYAINVGGWSRRGAHVVVLSAGPNGQIESPFLRGGAVAGGDDVAALIGSGGF